MKDVLAEIAQVVQECAQFVVKYSETKSFCTPITSVLSYSHDSLIFFIGSRLGKNVLSETASKVANYNLKLDRLMQELRDQALLNVQYNVQQSWENLSLDILAYAGGVGLITAKKCLDGTRTDVLNEIVDWVNNTDTLHRVSTGFTDKLARANLPLLIRLLYRLRIWVCLGRASVSVVLENTKDSL